VVDVTLLCPGNSAHEEEKMIEPVRYVVATPAYGRDYLTEEECRAAWEGGADFRIQDVEYSGYIDKSDKPEHFVMQLRFNKLHDICIIDYRPKDTETSPYLD
jgi:hypothetical protein